MLISRYQQHHPRKSHAGWQRVWDKSLGFDCSERRLAMSPRPIELRKYVTFRRHSFKLPHRLRDWAKIRGRLGADRARAKRVPLTGQMHQELSHCPHLFSMDAIDSGPRELPRQGP
jgi:hypothetical protein